MLPDVREIVNLTGVLERGACVCVKRRGLADPQARAMGRLSMAGSGERAAQRREKETDRTSLAERETGEEDR